MSIRRIHPGALRTSEAKCRWTTLDESMTDILTRQDLLIGTRHDLLINDRIAGFIRRHGLPEGAIIRQRSAINESLACVTDDRVVGIATVIRAAGDRDPAEPLFVGICAVLAVDGEGEHGFFVGFTLDLLEGIGEVLV